MTRFRMIVWIASAALFMTYFVTTARAANYVYVIDSSTADVQRLSGAENWANYWAAGGFTTFWYAPTAVASDSRAAASAWSTAVPNLKIVESTAESIYDMLVTEVQSAPCGVIGASGCMYITGVTSLGSANANYITDVTIEVLPSSAFGSNQRPGTLAHEIGHVLGLDEQYLEGSAGCNPNVSSVMDRSYQGTDGLLYKCDGTSPTSTDQARVNRFYSIGSPLAGTLQASAVGTKVTITWKDDAYGEWYWQVRYYWYGSFMFARTMTIDQGLHAGSASYPDRVLTDSFDRSGSSYGPGSWSACARPYFQAWSVYGSEACVSFTLN